MPELTIQCTDEELVLLTRLGEVLGKRERRAPDDPPATPAADVLERLLDNIDSGIRRPGSWERPWLCQALGFDWLDEMEPDPEDHIYERFVLEGPELCSVCAEELSDEDRMKRDPAGAFVGLCWLCEDARDAEAQDQADAAVRKGRRLPCHFRSEPLMQICVNDLIQADRTADALSAQELERRAGAGEEEHRPHGTNGGSGCVGCTETQDFLCLGCQRWRCFCRGGCSEPVVVRSFCDVCCTRYLELLRPHRFGVLDVLEARLGSLIPPKFLTEPGRVFALGPAEPGHRLPRPLQSLVALTRWGGHVGVNATERLQQKIRTFDLGSRALRRATPRQLLALSLLTWPGHWSANRERLSSCLAQLQQAASWPTHSPPGWKGDAVWTDLAGFLFQLNEAITDQAIAKLPPHGELSWLYATPQARAAKALTAARSSAEVALLGGILRGELALEDAVATVREDEFVDDSHRVVFKAMKALARLGTPITEENLRGQLCCAGDLAIAGGIERLNTYRERGMSRAAFVASGRAIELMRAAQCEAPGPRQPLPHGRTVQVWTHPGGVSDATNKGAR